MLDKVENRKRAANVTPFTTTCKSRQGEPQTFLIDVMTDEQISQTYDMICAAAQRGQGFGVDEYSDESEFRADIDDGYRFVVIDKDDGEMVAAFILAISKYSRGCPVADPFIIVKDNQRGRGLGKLCMDLCVDLAAKLGFMGMYVDTFSNNTAMLKIIKAVPGLQQVGCLPMGGVMTNGEMVGTVIFYKDLRPDNSSYKG
ncbi:uncharacterized protein [Littorina saxatilis]|uniref:N-acetyltransferase domain-containing protein n=1 Tax=Littorina saxatilis TaxID=31220 RepID=A0AAN9AS26_9CAEN